MNDSNVMLVIHSMTGGGSERQMSYLANECARNYVTTLVTLAPVDSSAYSIDDRIVRVGLGLSADRGGLVRGAWANRKRIDALGRTAMQIAPDVILSFCDRNNILTALACSRIAPVILCERSDPRKQRLSRVWEWLRDRAYCRATTIVGQTQAVTNYLQKRYSKHQSRIRWATIPSAVEIPPVNAESLRESRRANAPKRLLLLGRLSPEKRVDRVISAWGKLAGEFPDWQLSIVGDGAERSNLMALAEKVGIANRIEWVGWAANAWEHYFRSNAFCLASDYEGFPQAMLEAMASGLPVVVRECSDSVKETITHDHNGLLVRDDEMLISQLRRVMNDSSFRELLGRNAMGRAHEFSWPEIAPSWHEIIRAAKQSRQN